MPSRARSRASSRGSSGVRSARTCSPSSSRASSRRRWTSTARSRSRASTCRTSTRSTSRPPTASQFAAYEGSLIGELQEYLGEHARREGYALLTAPTRPAPDRRRPGDGRVRDRDPRRPARGAGCPRRRPTPARRCRRRPRGEPLPPSRRSRRPAAPAAPAATMIYRPETPLDELEEDAAPPPVQRETVTLTVDGRVVPITVEPRRRSAARASATSASTTGTSRAATARSPQESPTRLGRRRSRLDERDGGQRPQGLAPHAPRRR